MLTDGAGRVTWFLRKATASPLEHHSVCHVRSLRCRRVGLPRRGHRLFGNVVSLW